MKKQCVILVHGLGRRKSSLSVVEKSLRARGFAVVNWDYLSTRQSIECSAQSLYEVYQLNARNYSKIFFITHSLGGIVVRCMLKHHPAPACGGIVMMAPPNQGSAVARMLLNNAPLKWFLGPAGQELQSQAYLDSLCSIPTCPTLIISGSKSFDPQNPLSWITTGRLSEPNDGTVTIAETHLTGVTNYMEVYESHTTLPRNASVIEAAIAFITPLAATVPSQAEPLAALNSPHIRQVFLDGEGMPNIAVTTDGGKVWWADLTEKQGWKLQQNILFGNCRILDPKNIRRAWGTKEQMQETFQQLVRHLN